MENKRKKNTRQRAGTTHGFGSMKKNRGAGHRGGRGRAGSGKRGDVQKPNLTWKKGHKHIGKVGFTSHSGVDVTALNLTHLESGIATMIAKGLAVEEKGVIKVDLSKLKYNKLLGSGKVTHKYEIVTKYASEKAVEKVEALGGKIIFPEVKADKKTAEVKEE